MMLSFRYRSNHSYWSHNRKNSYRHMMTQITRYTFYPVIRLILSLFESKNAIFNTKSRRREGII